MGADNVNCYPLYHTVYLYCAAKKHLRQNHGEVAPPTQRKIRQKLSHVFIFASFVLVWLQCNGIFVFK